MLPCLPFLPNKNNTETNNVHSDYYCETIKHRASALPARGHDVGGAYNSKADVQRSYGNDALWVIDSRA